LSADDPDAAAWDGLAEPLLAVIGEAVGNPPSDNAKAFAEWV